MTILRLLPLAILLLTAVFLQPTKAGESCNLSPQILTELERKGALTKDCVLLPSRQIEMHQTSSEVPESCSIFLGSWGNDEWRPAGTKQSGRPHRLTVTSVIFVDGGCRAKLIYSWGAHPDRPAALRGNAPGYLVKTGGRYEIRGVIRDGQLTITDKSFAIFFSGVLESISVTYNLNKNGNSIDATFTAALRKGGGTINLRATLVKSDPLFF